MAGRYKAFNETLVLQKALEVFWIKGYEATSTQDLLKAMQLNKGSLYNTFKSKKNLYITTIEIYAGQALEKLDRDINNSDNPIDVIKDFLYETCEPGKETEDSKGCFLGNTVMEMASIDKELAARAAGKLKKIEKLFLKALIKAKENGQLEVQHNPKVLSEYLINLWNGINLTRRIYKDKTELKKILDLGLAVL